MKIFVKNPHLKFLKLLYMKTKAVLSATRGDWRKK